MSPVDLSNGPRFSTVERSERMLPREYVDHYQRSIRKHRKPTSTRGGRAWSEEEETFLIENRLRQVPDKVIAAHLHKTDLACRLHYHQLGSPNGRQERTLSMSSTSLSSRSSFSTHLESTSTMRRDSSPDVSSDSPGRARSTSVETLSPIASPPHPHVTIFPHPVSSSHQRWNGLRLDTTNVSAYQQHATLKIDEVRLRQAFESVYPHFWALVTANYGLDFAPATLEKAWCRIAATVTGSDALPTPSVSPQTATAVPSVLAHVSRGPKKRALPSQFHAINEVHIGYPVATATEKSSFSISSLLTGRKEHETR